LPRGATAEGGEGRAVEQVSRRKTTK